MMTQELKKQMTPAIRKVLKKYGMKGSIAAPNHMKLRVTLSGGKLDLIGNHIEVYKNSPQVRIAKNDNDVHKLKEIEYNIKQLEESQSMNVNTYCIDTRFSGEASEFLNELKEAMNVGNWDNSDAQTDYFDVGWYIDISIGRHNRPYKFEG